MGGLPAGATVDTWNQHQHAPATLWSLYHHHHQIWSTIIMIWMIQSQSESFYHLSVANLQSFAGLVPNNSTTNLWVLPVVLWYRHKRLMRPDFSSFFIQERTWPLHQLFLLHIQPPQAPVVSPWWLWHDQILVMLGLLGVLESLLGKSSLSWKSLLWTYLNHSLKAPAPARWFSACAARPGVFGWLPGVSQSWPPHTMTTRAAMVKRWMIWMLGRHASYCDPMVSNNGSWWLSMMIHVAWFMVGNVWYESLPVLWGSTMLCCRTKQGAPMWFLYLNILASRPLWLTVINVDRWKPPGSYES